MSPPHDVVGVDGETEDVCRNESELGSPEPNKANDEAICARHDPALPHPAANQNGRSDGQQTRDIVQTKHACSRLPDANPEDNRQEAVVT